jgi:hypothetical protein
LRLLLCAVPYFSVVNGARWYGACADVWIADIWSDVGAACGCVSRGRDAVRRGGDRNANRHVCEDAFRALPPVDHFHPSPNGYVLRRRGSTLPFCPRLCRRDFVL